MRAAIGLLGVVAVVRLAGPALAQPLKSASGKLAVDLALIEPSGVTLAERTLQLQLGIQGEALVKQGNRTVSVKTTVRTADKAGCHRIDLVVFDRDIDSSGQWAKKEWQTTGETCGTTPLTLGPREETRVRVTVRRG